MHHRIFAAALAGALVTAAGSAQAGTYSDDLGRCLVGATSAADQTRLVTWLFSVVSVHPDIRRLASITDAQRAAHNREAGLLLQRLMTEDCRKQTVTALRYEGGAAIERGFSTLGEVAMRGLMSEPTVAQQMGVVGESLDQAKFEALGVEAGLRDPKK